jgi:carbohydrate kinase (thermoresistant glucokinase family)
MKIVLMGITGSGKTTVGKALAQSLGVEFIDGDDLHPDSNKKKMTSGVPLDDSDREPWLRSVGDELMKRDHIIIACSALKRSYRDQIRARTPNVRFIHLTGSRDLIHDRLRSRSAHFMPITLLDSQFEALEPLEQSEQGFAIESSRSVNEIVDLITASL